MTDPQCVRNALTSDPLLLTPEQAAQVLCIGRTAVYALMKAGELRRVHIGRSCRISRAELERYVDRLQRPATPPMARQAPRRRSRTVVQQGGLFDVVHSPPAAS